MGIPLPAKSVFDWTRAPAKVIRTELSAEEAPEFFEGCYRRDEQRINEIQEQTPRASPMIQYKLTE